MKEGVSVVRLSSNYQFKFFDCGNQDLNDFLLVDAKDYVKRLLSVSNDRISIPDSDKATWRRIKKLFHIKNIGAITLL